MLHQNRDEHRLQDSKRARQNLSEPEAILWSCLKNDAVGFRVRRQFPIGPYTLDFYCARAKLCVEVDSRFHDDKVERDAARDAFLQSKNIQTLRVHAYEIATNLDGIIEGIRELCRSRVVYRQFEAK
ncbi:MAG: DUF559 domain-containing protein [Fimbriimonadales bacterium]